MLGQQVDKVLTVTTLVNIAATAIFGVVPPLSLVSGALCSTRRVTRDWVGYFVIKVVFLVILASCMLWRGVGGRQEQTMMEDMKIGEERNGAHRCGIHLVSEALGVLANHQSSGPMLCAPLTVADGSTLRTRNAIVEIAEPHCPMRLSHRRERLWSKKSKVMVAMAPCRARSPLMSRVLGVQQLEMPPRQGPRLLLRLLRRMGNHGLLCESDGKSLPREI